ncbi:MAG: discoidin domain-containing protein [Solirubrobacteraceae bacterium]
MSSATRFLCSGRCSSRSTLLGAVMLLAASVAGCGRASSVATLTVNPGQVLSAPGVQPLGVGVDGHGRGEIAQIYTAGNLRAMLSAGLGPLALRLRTELASEAWHWNPVGRFSDARCGCGYWTSSDRPGRHFSVSYGYRLPRRGNTIDQAGNDGYSRIDDGDRSSFWKSNPYLDGHPQWVMIDLGSVRPVDAAVLDWGVPYARSYEIQYWQGATPPARYGAELENATFARGVLGSWRQFPRGSIAHSRGGRQHVSLAAAPLQVRYLRVLMSLSSHTGPSGDPRNRAGFALREIGFGGGGVRDWVRHGRSNLAQSVIWVSSTDPWHRASDLDRGVEQPSFDTVFGSGLARGKGALVPVPIAYGTPQDAAAELRWLRRRGYPVSELELGEEPDGQLIGPEDYGSLYARFARVLHGVPLGGPGFSTSIPDWSAWPDGHGTSSWTARLLAQLRREHAIGRLNFFSFEWYPVDDVCGASAPHVRAQAALLREQISRQRAAGLPRSIPLVITEYGYSPFAAQAEVGLAGALIDADIAASFLAEGGSQAYLYGYEPDTPIRESTHCSTYGNLALLRSDASHRVLAPYATFWAMQLLARHWWGPGRQLVAARLDRHPPGLSAYVAARPDGGGVSVLLINKGQAGATVRMPSSGPLQEYLLSRAQYRWHPRGAVGFARPDLPPVHLAPRGRVVSLPGQSLAVVCLGPRC